MPHLGQIIQDYCTMKKVGELSRASVILYIPISLVFFTLVMDPRNWDQNVCRTVSNFGSVIVWNFQIRKCL